MPLRLKARSKYHAQRTTVDGITFASKRESARYRELKILEKCGQIARLKLQQRFELCVPKTNLRGNVNDLNYIITIGHYIADFCYDELDRDRSRFIVEDVKGVQTQVYLWKKRHMKAQYGIEIRET